MKVDSSITYLYSGIDLTHPEFEGRAKFGTDTVDNPPRQDDPNGHGTHVAGEKQGLMTLSILQLIDFRDCML